MSEEFRYPRPAVSAVLFNRERKVLMTLRSARVWAPGRWCLPGGHLEGGLDWKQSLRKEVREETGLTVRAETLVGLYSDPERNRLETEISGRPVSLFFLVASFLVTDYDGEVILNEEADEYGWFHPQELPGPLLPCEEMKIADAVAFQGKVFVR